MRRTVIVANALLLLTMCSEPAAPVHREVVSLVPRTLPANTPLPYVGIERSATRLAASWRFDFPGQWSEYRDFVVDRLKPDYSLRSSSEAELVFSRILPADAFRLVLRRDGTSIRCEFLAQPF